MNIDVLCVGHASYDLVFSVDHHPTADEKIVAEDFLGCGGGPTANAAVTVARLGFKSAFAGYLGQDIYGEKHYQELLESGVNTSLIVRGTSPTPLSTIIVKPNGNRALINYKGKTQTLPCQAIDFSSVRAKVVLFDGHEPHISLPLLKQLQQQSIPTVLDAGSVHEGTAALMSEVDYLVCSEKFAVQFAGNVVTALARLAQLSKTVVITLGERGLTWQRGQDSGNLPAFKVNAIDTTGAGDAFHGAFAAAVASELTWNEVLHYASAAGALCCTKIGARTGIPSMLEHKILLNTSL
ncbi:MAG: PfkB family carbohydrate kinase [Methylococcales bacterium]|nr:PfkB family carbohydrate kinase [Methylococcales bacterium]